MRANIFRILIYGTLIFITIKLITYHYSLISYPNQLELREGASLQTTDALLKGINPFAFENQPQNTNVYGIFYSIICFPFAKLFGATLFVHRGISAVFILLSCYIFFLFTKKINCNKILLLSIILIFYTSLLYFITPLSRPDSLGLFLFLAALYIPYRFDYSYKSLALASIIGILAFFTKTFFLLIYPYLFLYTFLFISKKSGFYFAIFSIISFIIIVIIADYISKIYIPNTFFNHINNFNYRVEYARFQIYFFIKSYALIFIISFFSFSFVLIKNRLKILHFFNNLFITKKIINKINILKLNKPLFDYKPDYALIYLLFSVLIFYTKIGGHEGAWITYLYQIVTPFLLLSLLNILQLKLTAIIPFIFATILNIFSLYYYVLPKYDFNSYSKKWIEISIYVKQNNNILCSPGILSLMLKNNKRFYDSGLSEYFQFSHSSLLFCKIKYLKNIDKLNSVHLKNSLEKIKQSIIEKKFDLIILPTFYLYKLNDSTLSKNYYLEKTISGYLPCVIPVCTSEDITLWIWKQKNK